MHLMSFANTWTNMATKKIADIFQTFQLLFLKENFLIRVHISENFVPETNWQELSIG